MGMEWNVPAWLVIMMSVTTLIDEWFRRGQQVPEYGLIHEKWFTRGIVTRQGDPCEFILFSLPSYEWIPVDYGRRWGWGKLTVCWRRGFWWDAWYRPCPSEELWQKRKS